MAIDKSQKLIGLVEAAEILGLSAQTVRRMILRGDIVGYKLGSGTKSSLRVYERDVYQLIEESQVDPSDYDEQGYLQEWKK